MKQQQMYQLTIEKKIEGDRIDTVLSAAFPEFSRSFLQKLIHAGAVTVNGAQCSSKKYKVKTGDLLQVAVPEPERLDIQPEEIPLNIIYEDGDLLIIDKPKGMVVHPAPGNYSGTLVNAVLHHCGSCLSSINGVVRPGIVHRIDKDTSGLLMIAKNDNTHKGLAAQLADHSITRAYKAIVYHNFAEDQGTVNQPIGRDPKNRLRQAVTLLNSREAVTHYRVLERYGRFTLIEARLETGRTHQIRVHMAYINHPLLGDPLYGPAKNVPGVKGQMLHAGLLGFIHPGTGQYMEFESPLPAEFEKIRNRLRQGGTAI